MGTVSYLENERSDLELCRKRIKMRGDPPAWNFGDSAKYLGSHSPNVVAGGMKPQSPPGLPRVANSRMSLFPFPFQELSLLATQGRPAGPVDSAYLAGSQRPQPQQLTLEKRFFFFGFGAIFCSGVWLPLRLLRLPLLYMQMAQLWKSTLYGPEVKTLPHNQPYLSPCCLCLEICQSLI